MRKRIFIATLIVAVGAAVLTWQLAGRASSPQMERFLPADTLAFVEVANLSDQALQLVETEAWKVFSKTNPELAAGFLMSANYSGLLRADVAAALIGLDVNHTEVEPLAVVLAESDDDNFQQNVERFLSDELGELQPAVTDYRGVWLTSVNGNQHHRLSHARVNDLFIFSNRQQGVKKVIDVALGDAASLANDPRLREMRNRLGYTDGFFGFVDSQRALGAVHKLQASGFSHIGRKASHIERLFHTLGLDSVTAIGGVSSFEAKGVVERMRVETPGGGTGVIRAVLDAPAGPKRVLSFVPATASSVFVTSMGDPVTVYDELRNALVELSDAAHKADIDAQLAEAGVNLRDDLLASVGQEFALVQLPSAEPKRSDTVMIAEVRDPARLKESIERIAESHQLSISQAAYADQPLMVIDSGKPDHALQLALVDNFLTLGGRASVIEAVIDAHQSGNTMAMSPGYQQAFADRVSAPLFTFYKTNEDALQTMARTLGQGTGAGAAKLPETEALFPTALYGLAEEESLYVESYSPLGTFPYLLTSLMAELSNLGRDK